MTDLNPDPGGVFATDAHRRVLGHLPLPGDDGTDTSALLARVDSDAHTPFFATGSSEDEGGIEEVLRDLEADGHASQSKSGWKMTKSGLDAITGPVPDGEDS